MRGLSESFKNALKEGELKPILDLVKNDRTIELDIRENQIYLFYRGGALYMITQADNGVYTFKNDYISSINDKFDGGYCGEEARNQYSNGEFIKAIPFIKSVMDKHMLSVKKNDEREIQQLIVRENNLMSRKSPKNRSLVSKSTDYFFVGFEYPLSKNRKGVIDLVAIRYDTNRRSKTAGVLALVEVKFGTYAFNNKSGIAKHITDVEEFFADKSRVNTLKNEAVDVFKFKHELAVRCYCCYSLSSLLNWLQFHVISGGRVCLTLLMNY